MLYDLLHTLHLAASFSTMLTVLSQAPCRVVLIYAPVTHCRAAVATSCCCLLLPALSPPLAEFIPTLTKHCILFMGLQTCRRMYSFHTYGCPAARQVQVRCMSMQDRLFPMFLTVVIAVFYICIPGLCLGTAPEPFVPCWLLCCALGQIEAKPRYTNTNCNDDDSQCTGNNLSCMLMHQTCTCLAERHPQ